jgi:hypothetical protein
MLCALRACARTTRLVLCHSRTPAHHPNHHGHQAKAEGPLSLYKGTIAPLLGNMVLLGIHFPTFHKTRDYLEAGDAPNTFTPWKILAAGAAAGAAGSVVSTPTELIRTKMQMVRKNNILAQIKGAAAGGLNPEENYKGNWDCAKKILRNHGLRGIYSGYVSTLLRDMQGYAWFFFGYEATIHYLAGPGKTKADLDYMQVRAWVCVGRVGVCMCRVCANSSSSGSSSASSSCCKWPAPPPAGTTVEHATDPLASCLLRPRHHHCCRSWLLA